MSSVSSSLASSVYSAYMPQYAGPQTSDSSLVQAAASLSVDANILATMGASSTISQTSNPTSLLSWLVQPYASTSLPLPTLGAGDVSAVEQEGVSQQILSNQTGASNNSGIYNSSGVLTNQNGSSASQWSALMQNNPSLAAAMNADATDQGILSQLSTYA